MQIGEWINGLALIMGWTVMISGGLAMCGVLATIACTHFYRKMLETHSFVQLGKALRFYKDHHNAG